MMEAEEEVAPQTEVQEDSTATEQPEEESFEELNEEENMEDSQLEQCEVSQDVSLSSHSSQEGANDSNLMDSNILDTSTASVTPGVDEEENLDGTLAGRRKYKRKVYDLNATREKLPRRAKDLRFETDPDFVEVPPPAQPTRGRGRGRGRKKHSDVEILETSTTSVGGSSPAVVATPTRGRGRGRGRGGGRTPKIKTPRGAVRPRPPKFQVLEEDTRMSVENSFDGPAAFGTPIHGQGMSESPWTTIGNTPTPKKKLGTREIFDASSQSPITAAQLVEYAWPAEDTNAELWMVQEQVVSYLSVKGNFKRKYPDLKRRPVEMVERNWLRERNAVSETQANLGLTALLSCEVLDLFFNSFPGKYEEYLSAQSEKKEQAYKSKAKGSATPATATPAAPTEKKPFDPRLRAIKATAKWNAMFNKERVEERLHCLDLQSFTVQIPRRPTTLKPASANTVDPYPVAVIPGQFSSFFKTYSPYQLNCLPIGTVMRGPLVGQPDNGQRRKRRPTNASSARVDSAADSQTESDDDSSSSSDDSRYYSKCNSKSFFL